MLRLAAGSAAGLSLASLLAGRKVKAESLPWQTEDSHSHSPVSLDVSWLLSSKGEVRPEAVAQRKVLLLAYPRTGSTLLGELLAAQPDTSYFMEPLFGLMPVGQLDWDYVLEDKIETGQVPLEAVTALMGGLYRCEETVTARLEEWSQAPHTSVTAAPATVCRDSAILLAKTVRLHGARLEDLANKVPDLQVVHIVRDPRGVSASLQAQQEEWGGRTGQTYCQQVWADMALGEQLGPDRYIRVRYEDLAEDPLAVLQRIGTFTGVPLTQEVREAVAERMGGKVRRSGRTENTLAATNSTDYYSTVRPPGHRHDAWRNKLTHHQLESLECGVCGELMEKLGYNKILK